MKMTKLLTLCTLLALLLVPAFVSAQEQAPGGRGVTEFGFRAVTGEVYGRTQPGSVPFSNGFKPNVLNSNLNTYNDYRNAFYVPKINWNTDSLFGSQNYFNFQAKDNGFAFENGGSLSRNLTALATFGQYGHYKFQFRFDETPHIFSGTTRTLFSRGGSGVWNVNPALQNKLFSTLCGTVTATNTCTVSTSGATGVALNANTINAAIAGTLVPGVSGVTPFTQQESRKAGTGTMSWNITPDFTISGLFSREHQLGTRPIGFVFGSGSGSYVAEAPETLDYYTNNANISAEFGKKHWDALVGYQGSFFRNETPSMLVANPFSTVYNVAAMGPATGRMDLYPDNTYHQLVSEGALQLGKHVSLMANVTPGWLSQNAPFIPLTTNTFLSQTAPTGYPAFLPEKSLAGQVDTLAMNYTAVFKAGKNLKFVAKYQHYGYDNNTPDLLVRGAVGDTAYLVSSSFHGSTAGCYDPVVGPSSMTNIVASNTYYCPGEQSSWTSKTFDLGGTWFFSKKNSVKFGYQRGWMDRTNREVAETIEDSLYGALDMHLRKDLTFRLSGRHGNRMPQGHEAYEIDSANVYSRMADQATRLRNRGDATLQWDPTQRLSLSTFFGTLQDNYNQKSSVNSLTNLGDASKSLVLMSGTTPNPIYGPYYAYGLLNNIGRNYGINANFALTPRVTLFAEYAREKNTGVILQGRGGNPAGCFPSCDAINDFITSMKDVANSYYTATDISVSKKVDLSLYYSLSVAQSFVFSDGVNCQISNNPAGYCFNHFADWNLETGSPARTWNSSTGAMLTPGTLAAPALTWSYPQTVNRIHEFGAVAKFRLTDRLVPKFQYTFRQFANNDWQTGVVNPLSFVGTTADPTGTSALQKLLFLGADQPSFRAHVFTATMEYHF
jgi:hypothetical protein